MFYEILSLANIGNEGMLFKSFQYAKNAFEKHKNHIR